MTLGPTIRRLRRCFVCVEILASGLAAGCPNKTKPWAILISIARRMAARMTGMTAG